MTIKKPYISVAALFGVFFATGMTLTLVMPLSAQPSVSTPDASRYANLLAQSRAMSAAQRNQALDYFKSALALWKSGDFAAAELGFKQGLDIDPANGPANYYYADCLQRRGDRVNATDYMARAAALAPSSEEGLKAQIALAGPLKKTGESFKDCPSVCPEMVTIPSGSFTMGSPASELGRRAVEGPQHSVTIGYAFAVGKYDVTFDEWDACVADGGCGGYKPADEGWGRGNRPVINVSWDDAQAYAQWLSKKTGKQYRLLSEAEWEYAARAGTTSVYYWGDAIGSGNADCGGCGSQWDGKQTSPVGSFQANAFGLYDMGGNVEQWTADCYDTYAGAPSDGSASQRTCLQRISRGGAYYNGPQAVRAANRGGFPPDIRSQDNGFRVARTL